MSENVRLNTDVQIFIDGTFSDTDKTITVPEDFEWDIQSIFVEVATSAVAGNRQFVVNFISETSELLGRFNAGAVVPANVIVGLAFAPGLENQSAIANDVLTTNISKVRLSEGMQIRVLDSAVIDAGADNMLVHILINQRRG